MKPAPFCLTPGVVATVLSPSIAPVRGVAMLPIVDLQLVDRPRRSEDPRLAKANDEEATDG